MKKREVFSNKMGNKANLVPYQNTKKSAGKCPKKERKTQD